MLNILISILGILITILLIVGIHEFGHFIVAKLSGVKVLTFSIGFGKALYKWHDKSGTEYILAVIPLGGYVKMLDEREADIAPAEKHLAFNNQSMLKKMAIVIAGPFSNLLFAFIAYWLLFMIGFSSIKPIIGEVIPHSIAANAGLHAQEQITQIDNKPTLSWMSIMLYALLHTGNQDHLTIQAKNLTNNQTHQYTLDLTHWHMDNLKPDPLESLGFIPFSPEVFSEKYVQKNQYSFFKALPHAWQNTVDFTYLNFLTLGKILTGKLSVQSLGGPITIFNSAGAALNSGFIPFLSFLAFLSIAIGVINVLPIPGLDGGHILFQCIECVTRKPLSIRVQVFFYRIGIILLLLLMVQALVNDILRL